MSVFKSMFAKKEKAPTPQEAIQRIRDVEDLLNKKSQYLEKKIDEELDNARKHGVKNKRCILDSYLNVYNLFQSRLIQVIFKWLFRP